MKNNYENNYHRSRHSSDYMDDSDYGAYPVNRDLLRTPSILDERALSRMGSTSFFDENDYSAFTPDLRTHRKMSFSSSVCSTPLQTPKLNRDFGFVSSKKDAKPKPPRRSKEVSRPVSRQNQSSSRESTPVNNPVKSPVRPSRVRPGKNYSGSGQIQQIQHQQKTGTKSGADKATRPHSLQEAAREPVYESVSPVPNTLHSSRPRAGPRHHISSSDSGEEDFKTPQASPRCLRQAKPQTLQQAMSIYEDVEVGSQPYQNFLDNPLINGNKRASQSFSEEPSNNRPARPKMIPPRTSQDPIPTPRKSSLSRSRDQSVESLHSLTTLPRKIYPKKKEPHYKVPPSNPRPVNPNDCHLYSELVYEDDQKFNERNTNKNSTEAVNNNMKLPDQIRQNKQQESLKLSQKNQSSRKQEQEKLSGKSLEKKQKYQNNYPHSSLRADGTQSKQKINICKNNDLENNSNRFADANVKVELTGEDDKFYDAQEHTGEVLVKKSKAIATLPDGSKYPCVIVQKKSKNDNILKKESKEKKEAALVDDTPPKKYQRNFKNYTPVEMKLKPDWFDDLKIKEEPKTPKPTSIIDGVLYTSRALIEEHKEKDKKLNQKLNTFNLIEQEVFETYDVCKNTSQEYCDKMSKVMV